MELTEDNVVFCMRLVRPFGSMKRLPAEHRFEGTLEALAMTLVKACSSREVAAEISALVIECEEDFPAPATLRKYMKERKYQEQDVKQREIERDRREMEKQRQQYGGSKAQAGAGE